MCHTHGRLRPVSSVGVGGASYTADGAQYAYTDSLEVHGVIPQMAPAVEGVSVTVFGVGMAAGGGGGCVLGGSRAGGVVRYSDSWVECRMSEGSPGFVGVGVGDSQVHLDGVVFEYRPTTGVRAVSPATGSSEGGTLVTVRGSGFVADAMRCVVGSSAVGAAAASSVEVMLLVS